MSNDKKLFYNQDETFDKEIVPELKKITSKMDELGIPFLIYTEPSFGAVEGLRVNVLLHSNGRFPSPLMILLSWVSDLEIDQTEISNIPENIMEDAKTSGLFHAMAMMAPETAAGIVDKLREKGKGKKDGLDTEKG